MSNISTFRNPAFGSVRAVSINNEPYFVGKDVATILGYKDSSDAIKKHVDNEDKLTRRFADSGQIGVKGNTLTSYVRKDRFPRPERYREIVMALNLL